MFFCDLGVKDRFLGVLVQCFYSLREITTLEPLTVDESSYFCDDFTGPFKSRFLLSVKT